MKKVLLIIIIIIALQINSFSQSLSNNSITNQSSILNEKIKLKELSRILTQNTLNLNGIGIVAGLAGKGDSLKDPKIKNEIIRILRLKEEGFNLEDITSKNIALVNVSLNTNENSNVKGMNKDILIAALLDAKDLTGGVLLRTTLKDKEGITKAIGAGIIKIPDSKNKSSGIISNGGTLIEETQANEMYNILFDNKNYTLMQEISNILTDKKIENTIKSSNIIEIKITNTNLLNQIENIEINDEPRITVNERANIVLANENIEIGPIVFFSKEKTNILSNEKTTNQKMLIPKMKFNDFITNNSEKLSMEQIIQIIKSAKKINKLTGNLIIEE